MNTNPDSPYYQQIYTDEQIQKLPAEHQSGWTELSEQEFSVLRDTPVQNRMTKLRELRPNMSHNQRKQTLKRGHLR